MSKIKLTGSNSGYVEIDSAADAGNLTLQLPTSGTKLLSNAGNVFTGITTTGQLDINGSIDVSSTSVFNNDLTLKGGSYDVLWDSSDNALEFGTNAKATFGDAMQIYHDGNNSLIQDSGTGHVQVRSGTFSVGNAGLTKTSAIFNSGSGQQLNFNNNQKFITTNRGVVVTGICTATSFSGSGEALTRTTQYSHRNVIVNGAMLVAQRGTSSTAVADVGAYGSVDRFQMVGANLDQLAFLQKQTSDGPDGFSKCFEFDVTTPENALDANDLVYMRYLVEGQDLEPFFNANGTGKNFTLSFYVKAYQAGTYQLNIYKTDGARFITKTYTIASSGVWQRVVLNFTGDTNTSGMVQTTGSGFNIAWIFAAGTNYTSGSQSTNWGGWPGNAGFAAGHAVNSASSANNYFRITGVQLELGDIATPFEHRSFGEELERCRRYYQVILDRSIDSGDDSGLGGTVYASNGGVYVPIRFCPPMRTKPTVESSSNSNGFRTRHGDLVNFTSFTGFNTWSRHGGTLITSASGNKVVGDYYWIETDQGEAKLAVSAEL